MPGGYSIAVGMVAVVNGWVRKFFLWGLDIFLIFRSFLRSEVIGRSAAREATLTCHAYK